MQSFPSYFDHHEAKSSLLRQLVAINLFHEHSLKILKKAFEIPKLKR